MSAVGLLLVCLLRVLHLHVVLKSVLRPIYFLTLDALTKQITTLKGFTISRSHLRCLSCMLWV